MIECFTAMSPESIRARWHGMKSAMTAGEIVAATAVDPNDHVGLVATVWIDGGERIIGLSKLGRVVEFFSRDLQIQERLTTQIADALMEELNPVGAACVIEATHTCMTIRGAKKHGSTMVTSALRGIFKEFF